MKITNSRKMSKENMIKVSGSERELLREMVRSERATIQVFNLSNKQEQTKYERTLDRLDGKLA